MNQQNRKEIEVWEACDKLHEEGSNITYDGLGRMLVTLGYRRGSNNQLKAYLDSWKAKQVSVAELQQALPNRPDKLTQALDDMRAEAWREARLELEEQQAAHEKEVKQHQETLHYAQQEIAEVRNRYTTLQLEKQLLEEELELLKQQHHATQTALSTEVTAHRQSQALLAQAYQDKEQQQQQAAQQLQALSQANADLAQKQQAIVSEFLERMEAARHEHLASQEALKGELLRQAKVLTQAEEAAKHWQAQVEALKPELNSLTTQQNQLQEMVSKHFEDLRHDLHAQQSLQEANNHTWREQYQALYRVCEAIPAQHVQYTENRYGALLRHVEEIGVNVAKVLSLRKEAVSD